ncbi:hypothetical protein HF869_03290 [Lactobacillus amylovorus subsp. animalium]|uniref:restriction endonuclease subunit S n=1 Tax=Lactobacillus amylovorus TaxID=1604 RepID=UPI0014751447|nr:restriction endonuclease subunit S [Lactobacillus amylovorus]NME30116.1 hypothetical protein [Lactobacillus amylovorus]
MTPEQLRASILQYAMEGKLVKQDPNDEPASELLKKIKSERTRSVIEGKIKKSKKLPPITDNEKPFDIPDNWEWVRLNDLSANVQYPFADGPFGSNLKKEHYTDKKEVRIIQLSNIGERGWRDDNHRYTTFEHLKDIKRSEVDAGDIVIAKMMPAGRAIVVPQHLEIKFVLSSDAVKFVPNKLLHKDFLYFAINSSVFKSQVDAEVQGITRKRTSLTKLKKYILPIPPLEEQKRIVAKIEKLMSLVDEYAESYNRLQKIDNEFEDKLKQSVLQYAMEGKLVKQNPSDEPASELIKKIENEKAELVKEGKIKKSKKLPAITDEEKPFDIPDSWEWIRLGDYAEKITDEVASGSFAAIRDNVRKYKTENYAIMVKTADFANHFSKNLTYTDEHGYNFLNNSNLFGGELILSNIGSIGKCFIVPKLNRPMTLAPNSIMTKLIDPKLNKFLYYFIKSPIGNFELLQIASGTTMKKFNKTNLKGILIPIPPLNEQKRIVFEIEKIVNSIDKLSK